MTLFWGAAIFVIGGAIQTGTTGYFIMVVGRIISGFGVGLLSYVTQLVLYRPRWLIVGLGSTIVPIYQSEVSPAEHVSFTVSRNIRTAYAH